MIVFRNGALLLPAAFLLGALAFVVGHGRSGPGYEAFPLLRDVLGAEHLPTVPELRFLFQSFLVFVPAYLLTLAILFLTAVAEHWALGPVTAPRRPGAFRRAFAGTYFVLYFLGTVGTVLLSDPLRRLVGDAFPVAPVAVAAAPFVSAVAMLPAAAVVALFVGLGLYVVED